MEQLINNNIRTQCYQYERQQKENTLVSGGTENKNKRTQISNKQL